MDFTAKLFDPGSCQVHARQVTAASASAARSQFESEGLTVLALEVSGPSQDDRAPGSLARAPTAGTGPKDGRLDVAWWCRELRTLLAAGMTVVEALDTLRAQSPEGFRRLVHRQLVHSLQSGMSLSHAMASTNAFPPVLTASVKASERTSNLIESLDDFLRYHELLDNLRRKVVSAAIYPTLVFSLGMTITLFLLVFVIPRFAQVYANRQGAVGPATKLLLVSSTFLHDHFPIAMALFAALAIGAVWAWHRGWVALGFQWIVDRIPFLQRQLREFRLAKLYQAMALMTRGGYALAETVELCAGLRIHPSLRPRLHAVRSDLVHGRRVSASLSSAGLTDEVTTRLLAVGERTGNFDQILQVIASRHSSNFSLFVERATRVVEPVMLFLVSVLVGSVVLLMYMPVFDIASTIR
ncbi:type II secretion system F family protein [Roseateles sp. P5_D6]